MKVHVEPPQAEDVLTLLQYHLAEAHRNSPPELAFVLPIDGLLAPDITFWTAREGNDLLGFGALKALNQISGEVKSMRTAPAHIRKGVAAGILEALIAEARARKYQTLYLETGATDEFQPARRLYLKYGFEFCDPFSDYVTSDFNLFMCLRL